MQGSFDSNGPSERWQIELLGSFRVSHQGHEAVFRTRKTAGLLSYLAFYLGRPVSKDVLSDAFWPDVDYERARQSVRTALSALRSSLQGQPFESDNAKVRLLDQHCWVDAVEFHTGAEASLREPDTARLRSLHALYKGPLLREFSEAWILPQALSLEETYVQVTKALVSALCREGNTDEGIAAARKAVALHPDREELHVVLLQAYRDAGMASSVLKQYEVLERMLDEQWGESPSPEARRILDDLPSATPPVKAGAPMVTTLFSERVPRESGGFFGRDTEVADVVALLGPNGDGPRLVTLTGLGGSGKTRLAEAVAIDLDESYGGRVWLVPLTSVKEPGQTADFLVSRLGATKAGVAPAEVFAATLGPNPSLLVLDNLEQLVPDVVPFVEGLIGQFPDLRILATSRVPLGAADERVRPVGPLPLPNGFNDLAGMASNPSVQLLCEAAQLVRPGFEVTPGNARGVYELVHRLEGMPLALKLAATRLGTKSPVQVLASIGQRIDLSEPTPKLPERHRSLRAVVEWNLDLLDEPTQRDFAALSCCQESFSIDLASALLGHPADEVVSELVRLSLVSWSEASEELRFGMLETVREVASEELGKDIAAAEQARHRHFDYFLDLCTDPVKKADVAEWAERLEPDVANLLAAIKFAEVLGDHAWELVFGLQEFFWRRGRHQTWIGALSSLWTATEADLDPIRAARAQMLIAKLHYGLRDIPATYSHNLSAIDYADRSGDVELKTQARTETIPAASTLGHYDECTTVLKEALALLGDEVHPAQRSSCLLNLAWIMYDRANETESEPVFREALHYAEAAQDPSLTGAVLIGLGCAMAESDSDESSALLARAERYFRDLGHPDRLAHCLYYRAHAAYRQGDLQAAATMVHEALELFVANGIRLGTTPLTVAGNVLAANDNHEGALVLWGRAAESRRRYGMRMFPVQAKDFERESAAVSRSVSHEQVLELSAWGASATDEQLLERAFAPRPSMI